jgi:hypothetical protein
MTNLYRKSAGWDWQNAPEGYENIPMIVSTKNRGQHYYSLGADYPKGVDLARYPKETSEPRLKPTTQGNVYPGDEVGTILNKKTGDAHPVYDMVTIRNLLAGTGAAGAGAAAMPDEGAAEPIEREAHADGKLVGKFAKYIRPKTPELTAHDIAGLLRAGRSPEVTDSMLGQADPRLLHELYASGKTGVEMPMDYAARMKRASELGYDQPMYRGTQAREALNRSLQTERSGEGKTSGTGAWLSSNPDIAATYSGYEEFGPVTLPLLAKSADLRQVPWGGNLWSQGPEGMTTDQVARLAREQGVRGIAFPEVTDVGPHLWSRADLQKRIPETATSFSIFDPSIVRSPFARFDPRLDDLTDLNRASGGFVHREHHADGDPVGDDQEYPDGARPLTIYRGERPDAEPGLMDASAGSQNPFRHAPSFSYETPPQSALDQAAQKTDGERVMSMLGIENLPQGQTYASQGPTGIERALQVIPNPANYLKRQGEAARENFDMMGQGWNDLREGNYAAGALGLGGGALGYVMSPITGAERVLFRDPYLNATGNLRDAEAAEGAADFFLTGGLRGLAKMLRGKKSMEQLAAETGMRMRMPSAATAVGAGAAGMTLAPDEAEASNLQKLLKPIRAYHSSPHEFSKFDLSKIGTGEGNQSFGSGLYFAESPKVSGQGGEYWMQFFNKMKMGPEFSATAALYSNKFDRDKAIAALLRGRDYHAQYGRPGKSGQGADYELGARLLAQQDDEAAEMLRQGKLVGPKTYEVDIHANPDRLLNWDKKMDEQSPDVRKALSNFDIFRANNKAHSNYNDALERALTSDAGAYVPPLPPMPRDYTGKQIHGALRDQLHLTRQPPAPFLQSSADLSAQMNKSGIQSIKYLDGRSRFGEGDPTHNYVIFDDKLLDINRRYAEGGEVEGGADGGSVVDRALMLLSKQGR